MSFNHGDALFQLGFLVLIILIGFAIYSFFTNRKNQKKRILQLEEKVANLEKNYSKSKD